MDKADLAKKMFQKCIVPSDNGYFWDEYQLYKDIDLFLELANFSAGCIKSKWANPKNQGVLCALGRSGLALGVLTSQVAHLPLIWLDRERRVVPQSYSVEGKAVILVDSLSVYRWSAHIAETLLARHGARCDGLVILLDCDHFSDRQNMDCNVMSLAQTTEYRDVIQRLTPKWDNNKFDNEFRQDKFWRRDH